MEIRIPDDQRDPEKDYLMIPIPRGTFKEDVGAIEVCLQDLPKDSYQEVLVKGLQGILTRGMADIKDKENPKNRALAMEKAKSNLADLYASKIRMSKGVRAKGISGEVKTQAMRDAREHVKASLKAHGLKVSDYKASEISETAKAVLEGPDGPAIYAQAKATVEARKAEQGKIKIDLTTLKPDPTLVAKGKAKAKKTKDKVPLSEVLAKARPTGQAAH